MSIQGGLGSLGKQRWGNTVEDNRSVTRIRGLLLGTDSWTTSPALPSWMHAEVPEQAAVMGS